MNNRLEIIVALRDLASRPIKGLSDAFAAHGATLKRYNGIVSETTAALGKLGAAYSVWSGATAAARAGFAFNAMMEDTRLGIASLLAATQEYTDAQGKAMTGEEAWGAAMTQASSVQRDLQKANLETAATFDQLARAFQEGLVPAIQAGFSVEQVKKFSTALVQAATAMRIPLDMLGEEARSILTGTMQARMTRLKPLMDAAGLTNEKIKELAKSGQLYNAVMNAFASTTRGAEAATKNFSTILSNLKDIFAQASGRVLSETFSEAKEAMTDLTGYLMEAGTAGNALDRSLAGVIRAIRGTASAIREFAAEHPAIVAVAGAFGELAIKVLAASVALRAILSTGKLMFAGIAANLAFVRTLLGGVVDIVARGIQMAGALSLGLGAVASAVVAIAATIAAVALWDWIKEWEIAGVQIQEWVELAEIALKQFWEDVKTWFGGIPDFLETAWNDALDGITSFLLKGKAKVLEWIEEVKDAFRNMSLGDILRDMWEKAARGMSIMHGTEPDLGSDENGQRGEGPSWMAQEILRERKWLLGRKIALRRLAREGLSAAGAVTSKNKNLGGDDEDRKGRGPLGLDQINQAIDRLRDKAEQARLRVADLGLELRRLQMEREGDYYGAQVEEVRKWAEDARREIEKSITDAERQLREINERLARSGTGVTQAAIEEARRAEQFLVETRRQGAEARVRIGEIEQEKILAIQIATEERTRDIVTRMRLEEVSLIGTVKQQLEAQTEVLKAEMDRQLREVGNNYAAREAIIRAYATKIREVEEQASGSFWDGFKRSIEKMGNSAATAFQMGGSLAHIFSDRLGDAFDAIIGKTKSVSAAFKSMANSILRDVARMLASRFVLGLIGSFFGGPAAASISQSGAEWIDRQRDAIQPFARGGWITEPVMGIGASGRRYLIGEAGPELVVPRDKASQAPVRLSLSVAPEALHMTLRDWLEGELARVAAGR